MVGLLESVDDLGDGVEVADVPAGLQQSQDARQDRLTIIMAALVHYQVRHPCAHLRTAQHNTPGLRPSTHAPLPTFLPASRGTSGSAVILGGTSSFCSCSAAFDGL